MSKMFLTINFVLILSTSFAQVAINRDGTPPTDTSAMLEIKKALKSKLKVRSTSLQDTSILELSNRNTGNNFGTDFLISARREQGLYFTTTSDLPSNINDSLLTLRTNGNIGVGNKNPSNKLDVNGNINLTGTIKTNGVTGQANQILGTNSGGNLTWIDKAELSSSSNGTVGYGTWGDCNVNNISECNPVGDSAGLADDLLGYNVAISGNFAIVGAPGDDIGSNQNQGSISFYQFNGTNWMFVQKISEASGAAIDSFGVSVAMSGNLAIVGIPGDNVGSNADQGSVNIYQYNGSSWVFFQKLTDPAGGAGDHFGNSVSISGNFAVVGAELDDDGTSVDEGTASFYLYNGTSWVLTNKVSGPGGAAGDHFGSSVSISNQYAIIGADFDDGLELNQGSATTYEFSGSVWSLMQKISDTSAEQSSLFGSNVSISGRYAIVGAWNEPYEGTAWMGAAYIYQTNGTVWQRMTKIENNIPNTWGLGRSVSISGNYIVIGAETNFSRTGKALILVRIGNFWQTIQKFGDQYSTDGHFGYSVSIDGNTKRFLIGAPFDYSSMGKAVFGKVN